MNKLDEFYTVVQLILNKQNAATGLIPASSAVTTHGNYTDAWVRDNVYSILSVWALAMAYKRFDDQLGRAYELEHATVKCMRGILVAYIRQAHKVEKFKNTQHIMDALHAKFSTTTGLSVVGDSEWGHLQIDATSFFLLTLAQMTASGLQIVYTLDEVDFIQNLVFYIERAYRTPDYGIWERGNKINHGMPELNSSSIGMAVAALQAINGINLFGSRGGPSSVIHVLPDEIVRNYSTLHSALPRESYSKEIDAALLSVISYPAFAVHDMALVERTRSEIVRKLEGKYGCKRFLRDGHQTMVEDNSRPLFFTYMIIDGLFNGDEKQVDFYTNKLEPLAVDSSKVTSFVQDSHLNHNHFQPSSNDAEIRKRVICITSKPLKKPPLMKLYPELYIVPSDKIEAEKRQPHSQDRIAGENIPLVWTQSLKVVGDLIKNKFIGTADLDPLGRRFFPYEQKKGTDVVVQVVLLAENADLQARMAMYGLDTQTIESCSPITISTPSALRDVYSTLGENDKLGLSGRPKRPVGTLSTCKLYRCQGRLYAFLPHFMDREEFYLVSDNDYLVSVFEQELAFVKNNWVGAGRPTMVILLTSEMLGNLKHSKRPPAHSAKRTMGSVLKRRSLLDFMMTLRTGHCSGVRVRLGRLGEMVNTACIESLDFLKNENEDWHKVLKAEGLSVNVGKTLSFDVHQTNLTSAELSSYSPNNTGTASNRKMSIKVSGNNFEPYSPIGTVSPIFSDSQKSESEWRLNTPDGIHRSSSPDRFKSGAKDEFRFPINKLANIMTPSSGSPPSTASKEPKKVFSKRGVEFGDQVDTSMGDNLDYKTFKLADPVNIDCAIKLLLKSTNLYDQIDILHYLHSCKGLEYQVDTLGSVSSLLEEVYVKAMHLKSWSIVRQAAGLMRKVVNNLAINVSDLLIRQKPVAVGFGSLEFFIMAPMAPSALVDTIYNHCKMDVREAPLVMEILTYLGSFIRSSEHILNGIMRIRTHFFIIAMREEISRMRGCDGDDAIELLLQLSPNELKSLLSQVLTSAEHCNLSADPIAESYNTSARWKQIHASPDLDGGIGGGLPNTLVIRAQAGGFQAGNFARLEILRDSFSQEITMPFRRGFNVCVLDPLDGIVVETATFDTHLSVDESDEFVKLIEWLDPGMIVVVLAKDDCAENLTESARNSCQMLGSLQINDLSYRDSWCLIGEKGGHVSKKNVTEGYSSAASGNPTKTIEVEISLTENRRDLLAAIPRDPEFINDKNGMDLFLPSHGRWLRRRKNDGALNRVSSGFYPKVWKVLSNCQGILVGNAFLPRDPTVSEKTPEEFNFGLQVESILDTIRDPAERQISVDCLVIIWKMGMASSWKMKTDACNESIDIIKIIRTATINYWNYWIKEGTGSADEIKNSKKTLNDPKVSDVVLPLTPANIFRNSLGFVETTFEANEVFARRLFFDLPQKGAEGSVSQLWRACLVLFEGETPLPSNFNSFDFF